MRFLYLYIIERKKKQIYYENWRFLKFPLNLNKNLKLLKIFLHSNNNTMADKVIPVKVAVRIRPLMSNETACKESLRVVKHEQQIQVGQEKTKQCFTYDNVFAQTTPQLEVFENSVQPLLDALFKVYTGTKIPTLYNLTQNAVFNSIFQICILYQA